MDIYELRRRNLRQLIKDRFDENQAFFSKESGIKAPQINRWLSLTATDTRRITESSARKIEKKLHLPANWLDTPPKEVAYAIRVEDPAAPIYPLPGRKSARQSAIDEIVSTLALLDDIGIGMILEKTKAVAKKQADPQKTKTAKLSQ